MLSTDAHFQRTFESLNDCPGGPSIATAASVRWNLPLDDLHRHPSRRGGRPRASRAVRTKSARVVSLLRETTDGAAYYNNFRSIAAHSRRGGFS